MRKLRNLFFLIFLILFSKLAFAFPIETIHYTGAKQFRINIVFMSEGYTAAEMEDFSLQVQIIAKKMFKVSPYREYKNFFNIYAIKIPSAQSGTAHPHTVNDCPPLSEHPISNPDTYFQSSFDALWGSHRAVYVSDVTLVDDVLMSHFPEYTVPVVLINSPYPGGTGGHPIVMTSMEADPDMWHTFEHELGHYLGDLLDEYDSDGSCDEDPGSNATQMMALENIPWKKWISNSIPTTVGPSTCQNVGLFEGANHCPVGWYRPACNCKMRQSKQPFCAVCTEQLIIGMLKEVRLVEATAPNNFDIVHMNYGEYKGFAVSSLKTDYSNANKDFSATPAAGLGPMCISPNTISYQWKLDGVISGTSASAYSLKIDNGPFEHKLCVTVYDRTHWLKVNPFENGLSQEVCWDIEINH